MPTAAELAGAKVKHTAEELGEGETMILTLGALAHAAHAGGIAMELRRGHAAPGPRCAAAWLPDGRWRWALQTCCCAVRLTPRLTVSQPLPCLHCLPTAPLPAEDRGILDDKGNLNEDEEGDVVLENVLAVSEETS